MIDPRYSEDEQAERLKEWWKKNGTSVIVGATLGIGIIVGVNLWRDYVKTRAENASEGYTALLSLQGEAAVDAAGQLRTEYAQTPYAALAALYAAKISHDQGDADAAVEFLSWARANSDQASTRHVAGLRLARIYLEQGRVDEATALAKPEKYDGFDSQYHELVGDIAILSNDPEAALKAYEQAMITMPKGSAYSELLVLKLDHATAEAAK